MKWVLVVVLLVLLACAGYSWYYFSGQPKIISSASEGPYLSCSDSDGEDIYLKGYASYTFRDSSDGEIEQGNIEDWCEYAHPKTKSWQGLVRDSFCEGSKLKTTLSTCGRGFVCRNGACVKGNAQTPICSDSDGGIISNLRGRVVASNGMHEDDCWIATNSVNPENGGFTDTCSGANCFLSEGSCENDLKKEQFIVCQSCSNGACLT